MITELFLFPGFCKRDRFRVVFTWLYMEISGWEIYQIFGGFEKSA